MKTKYKPLSIYIHIPFCVRKCLYCDFLSEPVEEEEQLRYMDCLIQEIRRESVSYVNYQVQTIFIGGGTPSLIPIRKLKEMMKTVYDCYIVLSDAEITIEVNPGTVSEKKLIAYGQMGINRLSIGLQSVHDRELSLLGRVHGSNEFFQTYEWAAKSGFSNINIDLMSGIPGQTLESWQETLKSVLSLHPQPTHISAYSLIIEEGTPFFAHKPVLPDEDTDREMYQITNDILSINGYDRYEISNYARPGYQCRHNKVYWQRGEYVGFGIGAASLVVNSRFSNCRDRKLYMKQILTGNLERENVQKLSREEQMEETMFLGLRLTEGVSYTRFESLFHTTIEQVYPGLIDRLHQQGLIDYTCYEDGSKERIFLTDYGLDVSNVVMAEFLL